MIPFEQILEHVEAIPALSPAAVEALGALDDQTLDADELERIIRLDPALTGTFLRLANAACFGSGGQVESLRVAITRLGLKRTRNVITAAGLSEVIPSYIPGYGMDARTFWSHCAATALLTEGIYSELGAEAPPAAFAAALLHDIGRLGLGAIIELVSDQFVTELHESDQSFEELERSIIGVDHASIGLRIATAWRLPTSIASACAEHHEPGRAAPEHRRMIEIIHLADLLAYTMGYGLDIGGLRHGIDFEATEGLGISDEQLERIQDQIRESIEQFAEVAPD